MNSLTELYRRQRSDWVELSNTGYWHWPHARAAEWALWQSFDDE